MIGCQGKGLVGRNEDAGAIIAFRDGWPLDTRVPTQPTETLVERKFQDQEEVDHFILCSRITNESHYLLLSMFSYTEYCRWWIKFLSRSSEKLLISNDVWWRKFIHDWSTLRICDDLSLCNEGWILSIKRCRWRINDSLFCWETNKKRWVIKIIVSQSQIW